MQKKMIKTEVGGIFFVLVVSMFLHNLYSLCGHEIIGIMFGSVNDSIWEGLKVILLTYILWAILELMCIKPRFKKFVVSKIISLYVLGFLYIAQCLVFSLFSKTPQFVAELTFCFVSVCLSAFLSEKLYFSLIGLEGLFAPALFLLLLFGAFYCSFTPFPPKNILFMDRATGLYGIIPENIDEGAIVLDTIYFL